MLSLWFFLPVAALLVGFGLYFGALQVMRAQVRKSRTGTRKQEDSSAMIGLPLLDKIDRVNQEMKAHRLCVFIQPILLVAITLTYRQFNSRIDSQFLVTSLVACGIVFFFCLWNLIRQSRERKGLQLSYDAEVEVGQALDNLDSQGHHVFHGFAADDLNIDHIVVGAKGVFVVETKAVAKPGDKASIDATTVTYNGHVLFFPKWADEETVPHTVNQTDLFSSWLGDATGEPISARAIVAIPGWLVKRTTSEGVSVVNPDQFPSLFEHIKARPLTAGQIERIVEQIQRVRQAISLDKKVINNQ